jgi:hypothetical protein
MEAGFAQPSAADHQHVRMAVVVVIGVRGVDAAKLSDETGAPSDPETARAITLKKRS